jgi:photosystem II stability/assembly factor-like uncharacterized protein
MAARALRSLSRAATALPVDLRSIEERDDMRRTWRGGRRLRTVLAALVVCACLLAAACDVSTDTTSTTPLPTASATSGSLAFVTHWQRPTNGPTGMQIFAFVDANPQVGYACASNRTGPQAPAQLLTTADGGMTWTPITTSPVTANTCTVFVDEANADDLFVEQVTPPSTAPSTTPGATPGTKPTATPHTTPTTTPGASGGTSPGPAVWRSRDHGATWSSIKTLTFAQGRPRWDNIIVVGVRLVASAGAVCAVCAPLANALFASDDGGQSWKQIGQSIAVQGLQVGIVSAAGATLFVSAAQSCDGNSSCLAATPTGARTGARTGAAPLASGLGIPHSNYMPSYFFRSDDSGVTWNQAAIPGSHATALTSTRAASGGGYSGLALDDGDIPGDVHLYVSTDGGVLWKAVPSLANAIGPISGRVDVLSGPGGGGLAATPDGGVVVSVQGDFPYSPGEDHDRGVFYLPASSAPNPLPSWRPEALGDETVNWQVAPGPSGPRLWAIYTPMTADPTSAPLVYLDLQ